MAKPVLIVMAAGIGSRYGGVKQIDPIGPNGEIIIDYSIYDAVKSGFGKVVFVIRKEIEEAFREKVGATIEKNVETEYVFQELDKLPEGFSIPEDRVKPWGTGHAILVARDAVNAPFGVINADDFYGASAFKVLADYLQTAEDKDGVYDYSLVGYILENTLSDHGHVARGVCVVDDNQVLQKIDERLKIQRMDGVVKYNDGNDNWIEVPADSTVSMNMFGFTPSLFEELESRFVPFLKERGTELKSEFLLPEIVGALIREDKAKVTVVPTNEKWFGVTYKPDKPVVEATVRKLIADGVYPENLWA